MLDGMHDLQTHASDAIRRNSLATRKVGVGVMGLAHALMLLGLPYGSEVAEAFARQLSKCLYEAACAESRRLASRLGPYPAFDSDDRTPLRNANLTAIAGTATIALIVGTSCGIEPIISHVTTQRVIESEVRIMDPIVSFLLRERGFDPACVEQRIAKERACARLQGTNSRTYVQRRWNCLAPSTSGCKQRCSQASTAASPNGELPVRDLHRRNQRVAVPGPCQRLHGADDLQEWVAREPTRPRGVMPCQH
jgi:hypothetical protein